MDLDVAKKQRKNAKGSITRIENYLEKNKDNVLQLYDYIVREEGLNKLIRMRKKKTKEIYSKKSITL